CGRPRRWRGCARSSGPGTPTTCSGGTSTSRPDARRTCSDRSLCDRDGETPQHLTGGVVDGGDVECAEGMVSELPDDRLDVGVRARVVDDPAQPLDLGCGQRGPERGVQLSGVPWGSGVEGEGD